MTQIKYMNNDFYLIYIKLTKIPVLFACRYQLVSSPNSVNSSSLNFSLYTH